MLLFQATPDEMGVRGCALSVVVVAYVLLVLMVVRMVPLKSVKKIILPATTNLEVALRKAREMKARAEENLEESSLPPIQLLTAIFIR